MPGRTEEASNYEYRYRDASPSVHHAYLLPVIRRLLSGLPAKAAVLDMGCGNGSLTAAWAHPGWCVYGVDASESAVRNATGAYPSISFSCAPIGPELAQTYGAGSFDAVLCAEVIEHMYLPRILAKCAFDLLRPGGILVVTTPYNGYMKSLALALSGNMDRHWTVLWDGGHIKFWSWKTIRSLLEEAGFCDLEFHGAGRMPFLWKSMVILCRKPKAG